MQTVLKLYSALVGLTKDQIMEMVANFPIFDQSNLQKSCSRSILAWDGPRADYLEILAIGADSNRCWVGGGLVSEDGMVEQTWREGGHGGVV